MHDLKQYPSIFGVGYWWKRRLEIVQDLQLLEAPPEQVPHVDSQGLHVRSIGSPYSLVKVQLASQSRVLLFPQSGNGQFE